MGRKLLESGKKYYQNEKDGQKMTMEKFHLFFLLLGKKLFIIRNFADLKKYIYKIYIYLFF